MAPPDQTLARLRRSFGSALVLLAALLVPSCVAAAQRAEGHGEGHAHDEGGPHFSHPLIAETPTPASQLRVDYLFGAVEDHGGGHGGSLVRLEGEYTVHRHLSVGVSLPYAVAGTEIGGFDTEEPQITFEFTSLALQRPDFVVGYGLELALPLPEESPGAGGLRSLEMEPYLNMGYRWRRLEVIAFAMLGIPMAAGGSGDHMDEHGGQAEFGYNLSLLYRVAPAFVGLVEFDGEVEGESSVTRVTPGVMFDPFEELGLGFGLGVTLPLSNAEEQDARGIASVFYHF